MDKSNELFELMTKMYSEMQEIRCEIKDIKDDVNNISNRVNNVDNKVNKNTILLEKMDSNLKLLAEGHETVLHQLGTSSEENNSNINDRLEVIELSTKVISKDVKYVKHKIHETEEDVFDIKDHLKIIK